MAEAGLTNLHIVPLDNIVIPEKEEIRPLEDWIRKRSKSASRFSRPASTWTATR